MHREFKIQAVALTLFVCALVASGVLATQLAASAGRHQLVHTDAAEDGDPPQVGVGIAMGAFRGLFVNFLWIRANELKEQGKYHEAMNLARAITSLQPRFPQVWAFHAWNMAYNISVTTQTQEERWQWVNRGVRLLRDEGIRHNPNDMLLHQELAWIFLHKIQGYTDEANHYYKRRLAEEWTIVLGPPPAPQPGEHSRSRAMERYVEWLQQFANAPDTLEGLYQRDERRAEREGREPRVRQVVETLRDELGVSPRDRTRLLRWYEQTRHIRRMGVDPQEIVRGSDNFRRFQILDDLVHGSETEQAMRDLINFVRRRALIEDYNMEPSRMIRYTEKYGPIDWRHPAAHALYWAARGVERALPRVREHTRDDFDFVNTDRRVLHAVQELYRSGDLYFNFLQSIAGGNPYYSATTNPNFVETYGEILEELVERSRYDRWRPEEAEDGRELAGRVFNFYSAGYENFMKDAIRFFYRRGQRSVAEEYLNRLIHFEGANVNDPMRVYQLGQSIDDFIREQFEDERFRTPYVADSEINAALQGAFRSGLLVGDMDLFRSQFDYAKTFHAAFIRRQVTATLAAGANPRMAVFDQDFRFVAGDAFYRFMAYLPFEEAERVYNRAPTDLRRFVYDMVRDRWADVISDHEGAEGRSFDEIFPRPDGMESFRRLVERRQQEAQRRQERGIQRR